MLIKKMMAGKVPQHTSQDSVLKEQRYAANNSQRDNNEENRNTYGYSL
jgi:hypothetical protein